jgi:hypothetical protein
MRIIVPTPRLGLLLAVIVIAIATSAAQGAPVQLIDQFPTTPTQVMKGVWLVDFERVAFGNLRLDPPAGASGEITVHFGEAFTNGRIERNPPGTVRYSKTTLKLEGGKSLVAAPPPDARNTEQETEKHPPAVLTPAEWGVVTPFRWVEIEGWTGEMTREQLRRQAAYDTSWDDDAASFESSDPMLNRIWDLCHYSIKATTFAGVFVDGDRERIPYEADAYLNQLSYYACNPDPQMARDTYDWLMRHPTWPTEWAPHMVFMAHADWMHTGDKAWLAERFDALKPKLQLDRAREDGLLVSTQAQIEKGDIVDWPLGERDNYVFTPVNTVVSAFHLRALALMVEMAEVLGRNDDAAELAARERSTRAAFQKTFFVPELGRYRDGEGTDHASLHASLFPLAFGLVPEERRDSVAKWLAGRGMACSVYAAQYLMEGLFENGQARAALELITAPNDRSWRHMVESGTTISWEAWDMKYKPNQDWNHAWGAAPANLLPRYVLGVQPLVPGWSRASIQPQPGGLRFAEGKVPTPHGPILVRWESDATFSLSLTLPEGVGARVCLPAGRNSSGVFVNGNPVGATRTDQGWLLEKDLTGTATVEVR